MHERPPFPRINMLSPLAKGLVFAQLGGGAGSSGMVDSSIYGNHATLTNMEPATDWVWDSTLRRWWLNYDGVDDYAIATRNPPSCLNAITIACWINIVAYPAGDASPRLVDWYPAPSLYRTGDNRVGWYGNIGGISRDYPISYAIGSLTDSQKHIAVTYDGITTLVYINGVLDNTLTTYSGALSAPSNTFCVAGRSTDTDRCLTGYVGDVLVFDRAVPAAMIAALADPSNLMLKCGGSSLIAPFPRRMWSIARTGNRRRRLIICGSAA